MFLAGDEKADELLARDADALLLGMVLDQQIPMEKAFAGPAVIAERMGGKLDVAAIADADPETFAALCARPPAVHRFPASMAGRIQGVCRVLLDSYDGRAENVWATADSGAELKRRLLALPGFGDGKARIFLALLGKQYGVAPAGWREAAGPVGAPGTYLSVADVVDPDSLARVRAAKKAAKAATATKAAAEAAPGADGSRR